MKEGCTSKVNPLFVQYFSHYRAFFRARVQALTSTLHPECVSNQGEGIKQDIKGGLYFIYIYIVKGEVSYI